MIRFILFSWLILIASISRADTILVLGDSLSAAYGIPTEQGWVNLMRQRIQTLSPNYNVVNASISGETSQGGLARLPVLLETHQPSHVLIELGANDGLRGLPPSLIKHTLTQLVTQAKNSGAKVWLLGIRLPPNYGPVYEQKFSALFAEVAIDQQITLVPFFMEHVALKPEFMQQDGLHPNEKGQPLLLKKVWPYLESSLAR